MTTSQLRQRTSDWIEKRFFLLTFVSLGLGLLLPGVFIRLKELTSLILVLNMFTLALGCRVSEFIEIIKSPTKVILTIAFVYGVLPLVALGLGKAMFPMEPQFAAGLVLIAVLPVAITSALWTDLTRGNLPFTISIITLTTLLAGVITPGAMGLLAGSLIQFDASSLIVKLAKTVILPVLVGIFTREKFPEPSAKARPSLSLAVKFNIFIMLAINASVMAPYIDDIGWKMILVIAAVFLQLTIAYGAGYGFSYLVFPGDSRTKISVAYICGMRNNGAGIVIALAYFPPLVVLPVIVSILMQQPLATVVRAAIERKRKSRLLQVGQV